MELELSLSLCVARTLAEHCKVVQSRLSLNHPVNHSPSASGVWAQLSELAARRHAILARPPHASTLAYGLVGWEPDRNEPGCCHGGFPHTHLAPAADILAISGHRRPRLLHGLAGTHIRVARGAVTDLVASVGAWSSSSKYAFAKGAQQGIPSGVTVWGYAVTVLTFAPDTSQGWFLPSEDHVLLHPAHQDNPPMVPVLSWSACSSFLALGNGQTVQILDVTTHAVARIRMRSDSWAWSPQGSCLLCVSQSLLLKTFAFGRARPRCSGRVDIDSVFNLLAQGSDGEFHVYLILRGTQDGTRAVVGLVGHHWWANPKRVAVVQIAEPAQVLGFCELPGDKPYGVDSLTVGVHMCAVCAAQGS